MKIRSNFDNRLNDGKTRLPMADKTHPPMANKEGEFEMTQQNQGRNQGNRQQQQQPPKPKCSFCGATQTGKFCHACGKPVEVTCGGCQVVVKNTTYCDNCGVQLNEPPTTQQPIVKNKTEKWELEVTPTGDGQGNYTIAIQVTKNGKGEKCEVYVAIGANSEVHDTNDKGFLTINQTINVRRVRLMVDVVGCQANTEKAIWLYGVKPATTGNFWADMKALKEFYRKS